MYVFRNGTISSSENIITAHRVSPRAPVGYKFARLHYPDIHIPNRGAAWGLFFLPEDLEKKQQLRGDVDSYNAYLDYLDCLDGFKSFFIDHDLCITRNDVTAKWSSEIAEKVFLKGTYVFSTDLSFRRHSNGYVFPRFLHSNDCWERDGPPYRKNRE